MGGAVTAFHYAPSVSAHTKVTVAGLEALVRSVLVVTQGPSDLGARKMAQALALRPVPCQVTVPGHGAWTRDPVRVMTLPDGHRGEGRHSSASPKLLGSQGDASGVFPPAGQSSSAV